MSDFFTLTKPDIVILFILLLYLNKDHFLQNCVIQCHKIFMTFLLNNSCMLQAKNGDVINVILFRYPLPIYFFRGRSSRYNRAGPGQRPGPVFPLSGWPFAMDRICLQLTGTRNRLGCQAMDRMAWRGSGPRGCGRWQGARIFLGKPGRSCYREARGLLAGLVTLKTTEHDRLWSIEIKVSKPMVRIGIVICKPCWLALR